MPNDKPFNVNSILIYLSENFKKVYALFWAWGSVLVKALRY